MTTSLNATVILCDAAQAADGKLYVMGGGWTRLSANSEANVSLGIIVHVPYDMTNKKMSLTATLHDDDGDSVQVGDSEVKAEVGFEMGRPPGLKQGEQMALPFAMNFHGLSLHPGGYVFEVRIQDNLVGRCPFRVI